MAGTARRHRNSTAGDRYNNHEITSPMDLGGDHKYSHNLMDVLMDVAYQCFLKEGEW
mgnify:FL=1